MKQTESGLFGIWLRFGSVTGFFKPAPSPKPRQIPKILAAHRYIFSVNALDYVDERGLKIKMSKRSYCLSAGSSFFGGFFFSRQAEMSEMIMEIKMMAATVMSEMLIGMST